MACKHLIIPRAVLSKQTKLAAGGPSPGCVGQQRILHECDALALLVLYWYASGFHAAHMSWVPRRGRPIKVAAGSRVDVRIKRHPADKAIKRTL